MVLDIRDLDTCVRCGLCLQACPTFRLSGMEGYSPRGRIASVKAAVTGEGFSAVTLEYLDTCLGCRACEAVCPSGVPYGRILEGARAAAPAGGRARRLAENVVLFVMARRARLAVVSLLLGIAQRLGLARLIRTLRGLPRIRLRDQLTRLSSNYEPADGVAERGQVVLFAGCVQDAWSRDVHWATIAVLTRLGYRVRVPHGQRCCGALHAHGGRSRWSKGLQRRNAEPLRRYEGAIVVNAAGCGAKLKEYEDREIALRVRDVSELIDPAELERCAPVPPGGLRRVAVHDPCHLAFAQGVVAEPRAMLRAAGYDIVELGDGGRCCGAAGTYAMHHPDWAEPLRTAKLDAIAAVAPDAVAVANPGCEYWMGGAAAAAPMFHPIQLVAMSLARDA